MTTLLLLFAAIGLAPLLLGLGLAARRPMGMSHAPILGSVLLCALAFNLVFFWQELWLVIPKALTPGLHPVLFHNDHDWTGDAPIAELLQGSGAIATLAIGLVFTALLAVRPNFGDTARLFCFWMAFQGTNQSLTQLAIGTVMPGNDVGRALAYLGIERELRIALAIIATLALAAFGMMFARLFPSVPAGSRVRPSAGIGVVVLSAILSVILIVPFRVPRNPIETTAIPLVVNLIGAGWTTLGFALAPAGIMVGAPARARLAAPILWLSALLLIFQLVLRRGISF